MGLLGFQTLVLCQGYRGQLLSSGWGGSLCKEALHQDSFFYKLDLFLVYLRSFSINSISYFLLEKFYVLGSRKGNKEIRLLFSFQSNIGMPLPFIASLAFIIAN